MPTVRARRVGNECDSKFQVHESPASGPLVVGISGGDVGGQMRGPRMFTPAWHPWPAGAARSPHRSPRPRSRERGLAPVRSLARSPTTPSTRIRVRPPSRSCHQDVPQASPQLLQCPSPQHAFFFFHFLNFLFLLVQVTKSAKLRLSWPPGVYPGLFRGWRVGK